MTFLAYLTVILGGPIILTVTALLFGFLLVLALALAPINLRVVVASSAAGLFGAIAVSVFGFWIFDVVADKSMTSIHPLIAIAAALLIPFFNDIGKAKKIRAAASALPPGLEDETAPQRLGLPAQAVGYVIGFVLLLGWLASGMN